MRSLSLIIIVLLVTFSAAYQVSSDVVYFDGGSLYGRVIKETPSSVVVETVIGKVTINKERITNIKYTKPEEDFLKFGDYCFARSRYDEAIKYYEKSLKANPDFAKAKKALKTVQEAKRHQELIARMKLESLRQEREKEKEELKSKIGLVIEEIEGRFRVTEIAEDSPADLAQIKPGDYLVSIEGRSTKNRTLKKVWGKFLGKKPISFTIEREVNLIKRRINYRKGSYVGIGIFLIKDAQDNLVISEIIKDSPADRAGMKIQDKITEIDGTLCKSFSLDEVGKLLTKGELSSVNILIQRNVKVK